MSIETDADVNIKIQAEDNASLEIDQATKRINKSFNELRIQQRQATREFEVNNRVLVQGARTFATLGRSVSRMISIYNTFQLHSLRVQLASKNVADAQKTVNEAFLEFGLGSREHLQAIEQQNQALAEQKRITDDNAKNWLFLGLTIATTASQLISRTLPQLIRFSTTVKGLGLASAIKGGGGVGNLSPVGGLAGKGGGLLSGKSGSLIKGGGALLGVGLFATGVATSQFANEDRELSTEEKLTSLLQTF